MIWAIDKRHPWYLSQEPRAPAATRVSLRGSLNSGGPQRRYFGPLAPKPAALPFDIFGTRHQHRIIMLLTHTNSYNPQTHPIRTLGRRVCTGETSVTAATDVLEKMGIVCTRWREAQRPTCHSGLIAEAGA